MPTSDDYDLTGIRGAEIFRELGPGIRLRMTDGSVVEVIENAGDGAWLLSKIIQDPASPDRVGTEEHIFYAEVESVIVDSQDGAQ